MKYNSTKGYPLLTQQIQQKRKGRFGVYILGIFLSIFLVLGFIFRFANLDRRMYWHDEALTSFRVSGYTRLEVIQVLSDGAERSAQDLLQYQRPGPGKNILDTLRAAVTDAPLHPPLYYLISRFWMDLAGYSPQAMRSLAAVISIFVLPGIYWLSIELFGSRRTAVLATVLIWLSPIQVLFAREARQYSLWTVATLFASAALLHALRVRSKGGWALYFVMTTIGLYTHLLYGFVAIAHGLYVLITLWQRSGRRIMSDRTFIGYFYSSLAALLVFVPWILVLIRNRTQATQAVPWAGVEIPVASYMQTFLERYGGVFVDLHPFSISTKLLVVIPILVLTAYSFYFLWRNEPKDSWLFVFLLIGVTAASLTLPDLISGGFRSVVARYLVPSFIAILLSVAYFLSRQTVVVTSWRQTLWGVVTITLFILATLSSVLIVQAESWWDKGNDFAYPQMAQIINDSEAPLIIINGQRHIHFGYLLAFGQEFPSHVNVKWSSGNSTEFYGQYSDVFLYQATPGPAEALDRWQDYQPENLIPELLWRLTIKG